MDTCASRKVVCAPSAGRSAWIVTVAVFGFGNVCGAGSNRAHAPRQCAEKRSVTVPSSALDASTDFKAHVDGQAGNWITTIGDHAPTFDSGYLGYPADFDLGVHI